MLSANARAGTEGTGEQRRAPSGDLQKNEKYDCWKEVAVTAGIAFFFKTVAISMYQSATDAIFNNPDQENKEIYETFRGFIEFIVNVDWCVTILVIFACQFSTGVIAQQTFRSKSPKEDFYFPKFVCGLWGQRILLGVVYIFLLAHILFIIFATIFFTGSTLLAVFCELGTDLMGQLNDALVNASIGSAFQFDVSDTAALAEDLDRGAEAALVMMLAGVILVAAQGVLLIVMSSSTNRVEKVQRQIREETEQSKVRDLETGVFPESERQKSSSPLFKKDSLKKKEYFEDPNLVSHSKSQSLHREEKEREKELSSLHPLQPAPSEGVAVEEEVKEKREAGERDVEEKKEEEVAIQGDGEKEEHEKTEEDKAGDEEEPHPGSDADRPRSREAWGDSEVV